MSMPPEILVPEVYGRCATLPRANRARGQAAVHADGAVAFVVARRRARAARWRRRLAVVV